MSDCRCMFYGATEAAESSRWMPWEVGYFDAKKDKVAILPIKSAPDSSDTYVGQEYLSLYNYVVVTGTTLYIHKNAKQFVSFQRWLDGASLE